MEPSRYFLDKRCNKSISISTFLQLIELVLKMNSFHFIGRCYSLKQCDAIGAKIGPIIACLFMGYLEKWFFTLHEHSTQILCKRYIDDTVTAASCSEKERQCFINFVTNFNPSVKYTYSISDNAFTFFDLQLTMGSNHIKSYVYFRPTDSHNHLLLSSSHPPSCKHSIPLSQH